MNVSRRRKVRWAIASSCVVVAVFLSAAAFRRLLGHELLSNAVYVADVTSWWNKDENEIEQLIVWITNTELFGIDTSGIVNVPFLYDIRTHHRTNLEALSHLINDSKARASEFKLSPDRTTALWAANTATADEIDSAKLDGTQHKVWQVESPQAIAWEQDSRHWVALHYSTPHYGQIACTGDVNSPGLTHPVSQESAEQLIHSTGLFDETETTARAVVYGDRITQSSELTSRAVHTVNITVPDSRTIDDVSLSADGKYIIWELEYDGQLEHTLLDKMTWLRRLIGRRPRRRMELWLSKADGKNMYEVGFYPLDKPDDEAYRPAMIDMLPGDEQLSIVYKHALYVLPV